VLSDLAEEGGPIKRVESVLKTNLEHDFVRVLVAHKVLSERVDGYLCAERRPTSDLERPQFGACRVLGSVTEAFRDKPSKHLAHGNRTHTTILFIGGEKGGSSEVRDKLLGGGTLGQKRNDTYKLLHNRGAKRRAKSIGQMLNAKA
jgi:hypothetical protein